ncbi:MAG: hypothetical protein LBJ48_05505 [Coriobacteriales bacterium]|jgi:hypothetical protein|nr:hypothetical protein [Coriobacteriales bacterium]
MTGYPDNLHIFGIYLAKVYFDDKPDVYKVRPVVLIDKAEALFLVLKITSSIVQGEPQSYYLNNWRECGLNVPSSVVLSHLYQIPPEDLFCDRHLGSLCKSDIQAIKVLLEA